MAASCIGTIWGSTGHQYAVGVNIGNAKGDLTPSVVT